MTINKTINKIIKKLESFRKHKRYKKWRVEQIGYNLDIDGFKILINCNSSLRSSLYYHVFWVMLSHHMVNVIT